MYCTHCGIDELASDQVLEAGFQWLCRRRKHYPDSSDVWSFHLRWPQEKLRPQEDLRAGRYRFGLLTRIRLASGEVADMWSPRDVLVLKCLALVRCGKNVTKVRRTYSPAL